MWKRSEEARPKIRETVGTNSSEPTGPGSRRHLVLGIIATAAIAAVTGFVISQQPSTHLPSPSLTPSASLPHVPAPVFGGPVTGLGFTVTYDPETNDVVLFGGVNGDGKTWLWDGQRWMSASPRSSPTARYGAAAAYDPLSHMVMLFGGSTSSGSDTDDTWGWDGVDLARAQ